MIVQDARPVAAWLHRYDGSRVDVESLLAAPMLAGTSAYIELHEQVVTGMQPYCQLGIELEIERLYTTLGPALWTTAGGCCETSPTPRQPNGNRFTTTLS